MMPYDGDGIGTDLSFSACAFTARQCKSGGMGRSEGFGESADLGTSRHPVVITEAARSVEAQHRARVRRYLFIMSFRIPALIIAAIAYSAFGSALAAILIIAVSVPLPWIAVLIANDRPPRSKDEASFYSPEVRKARALESEHHIIEN